MELKVRKEKTRALDSSTFYVRGYCAALWKIKKFNKKTKFLEETNMLQKG
jgi:hypothetical protein